MPQSLAERRGLFHTHGVLLSAAVLAADMTADGFRASDVRFFFFLFSNWIERDAERANAWLELTQVRRLLERLIEQGHARTVGGSARQPKYALTPQGGHALAHVLTDASAERTFEEDILVVTFSVCYGEAFLMHLEARSRARDKASLGALRKALDPHRLIRRARTRIEHVLRDLDERIASSTHVAREASSKARAGKSPDEIAAHLESVGAYQFQHVRSFAQFTRTLPAPMRDFELGDAFLVRRDLLFVTFAAQARARLQALDALDARIRKHAWLG